MHRLYVSPTIPDSRASVKKNAFNSLGLKHKVGAVYLADCYAIDKKLNKQQLQKAAALLTNPLTEKADIDSPPQMADKSAFAKASANRPARYGFAVEIGYLPGVTDNIANTARETIEDGLRLKFKPGENVYTSQVLFIDGNLSQSDIYRISDSLYNPLIQKATIKTFKEVQKDECVNSQIPKVKLTASAKVLKVDLNVSDEELVELGKFGIADTPRSHSEERGDEESQIRKEIIRPRTARTQDDAVKTTRRGPLSLSLDYLKAIREYFNKIGRKPTDVELETLAQTWSEHCKHTIFADPMDELQKGLYKTYIKGATEKIRARKGKKDFCASVFTDNSGGIIFDKDYLITHKVETHNTPSALDPFGGAVTGIVGVNRDCLGFGLGAKPIINVYGFCVAGPNDKSELYRDQEKTNKMLSAKRILEGVVSGVNAGGNQSGIPTNLGFVYFDSLYRGKPLVFAGTVGLIPRSINNKPSHIKQAKPGDLIVMVGGRVGADGIHGATFSSEGLDAHSPATAVQIGDPITQKKFSDAIAKEARGLELYNSITDCGAGGLSSAVGEMAELSGGCLVNLDKVPLKYPGLAPWQIWISESQERMVLAVPPIKWEKFYQLMKKRGVEATIIGKFTDNGKCVIKFGKQTVLDLDMVFLHNGRPVKRQHTKQCSAPIYQPSNQPINGQTTNLKSSILKLLSRLNVASFEFISKQYDHEVRAGSVLKPLQGAGRINSDATITRPVLTSKKGVVLANALYPSYSELDAYKMAAASIDGSIRAAVAAGADVDYLALLDNFCWSSSDDPRRLWQLKEATRACYDAATAFGTPFISGKDSMFNDFKGFDEKGNQIKISIPPTLLISAIGVVPDVNKTVSLDAKMPGDLIYILGETHNELAGSEYEQMINDNAIPEFSSASGKISGIQSKQNFGSRLGDRDDSKTPSVDPAKNYRLYKSLFSAIQKDLVASAISVSRGGLAAAAAKMLIGGRLGGSISLGRLPGTWLTAEQALFSESAGRILITVNPKKAREFEMAIAGNYFARIGKTGPDRKLIISDKNNKKIAELDLRAAEKAYKQPLANF